MMRVFATLFAGLIVLGLGGALAGFYMLWRLSNDLPSYDHLADYAPPVMTRVHAGDGSLIAEYARERRIFVPIETIPGYVVEAFLAAEDKNFYTHTGVDARGILRAVIDNIWNVLNDRRLVGASTITQQVAKNFLLTSDVTMERKIREALLALKLERAFTKDEILELYLNQIYLGLGSHGVAAAALNYFDKSLTELSLAEAAYLAALPKAPNNYHPFRRRDRAIARRNWVIGRMLDNEFITSYQASVARSEDLVVTPRAFGAQIVEANYFVEQVRRDLYERYGEEQLYESGLSVRTTLDTHYQRAARTALRNGLVAYDQRHGWRGAVATLEANTTWTSALSEMDMPGDLAPWTLAVVIGLSETEAKIGLRPTRDVSGAFLDEIVTSTIPLSEMTWARGFVDDTHRGPEIERPQDVLAIGDVVYVEPAGDATTDESDPSDHYALRQIPGVNGGIVVLDPHTGRILALQGGFSYKLSEYNRAVQATRQPGSAFKPFVYAAALDRGFTPSSLVLDAPFVMDQGPGLALWKPENYGHRFYGPSTLRLGIEKSRNVMTVRLAQNIGMGVVRDYARRFGIRENLPAVLSMALGAGETTLLRLTTAYAMLVNGGREISPTLIDRIQDRHGATVYRHDTRVCDACIAPLWENQSAPVLSDDRARVLSPQTAYQVVSMLEGVVERGTARSVRSVGVPLAGKTGTTNDERDAWFVGFSPDLAVGVFVGFDAPRAMGRGETGGKVAAPIFRDFMTVALGGTPAVPFRIPPGINLVRVNAKTGLLATPGETSVILEAFKEGTEPASPDLERSRFPELTGAIGPDGQPITETTSAPTIGAGTGGLY
ncbi:MAG: penicillin-binding protein [Rhodobiaceae bacterium]|nr:MAG: penicillin-binding protein [Rhodobiaceae bacterium]